VALSFGYPFDFLPGAAASDRLLFSKIIQENRVVEFNGKNHSYRFGASSASFHIENGTGYN